MTEYEKGIIVCALTALAVDYGVDVRTLVTPMQAYKLEELAKKYDAEYSSEQQVEDVKRILVEKITELVGEGGAEDDGNIGE